MGIFKIYDEIRSRFIPSKIDYLVTRRKDICSPFLSNYFIDYFNSYDITNVSRENLYAL